MLTYRLYIFPYCGFTGGFFLSCAVHLLEQECAHVQEDRQRREKDLQLSAQHLKLEMQSELQKKVCVDSAGVEKGLLDIKRLSFKRILMLITSIMLSAYV